MHKSVKKAKSEYHNFLVDKDLPKNYPRWMKSADRPTYSDMTHAQWVANWWARAFCQLTAQAHTKVETVPVQCLLNEFLNPNRIAVENSCRVGHLYDGDLWSNLSEACKRKDKDCDPKAAFLTISEDRRSRAKNTAAASIAVANQKRYEGYDGPGHHQQAKGHASKGNNSKGGGFSNQKDMQSYGSWGQKDAKPRYGHRYRR